MMLFIKSKVKNTGLDVIKIAATFATPRAAAILFVRILC